MSLSHKTLSDIQIFLAPPCSWPPSAVRVVKELLAEHDRLTGEVCELKRKAAAFDATIEHGIAVGKFKSKWDAYNLYGKRLASGHATPLEAVEAAVKLIEGIAQ